MALHTLVSPEAALHWLRERGVRSLESDSRRVAPGDAFIAWPGHAQDGRRYVRDALAQGARACLVESQGAAAFDWMGLDGVAGLPELKRQVGAIASAFMGEPSRQLTMLASTGTNGKTSTAWWTAQALAALGRRCGVIGTLGSGMPPISSDDDPSSGTLTSPGLTTPDPISLHTTLRGFVDAGVQACAIEASSIGVAECRLDGTHLDAVMFTNLTQDHLDYHGTMQEYWAAKARLFGWPGLKAAVVNLDDEHGAALADQLRGSALALWTYSARHEARLRAQNVRVHAGGLTFELLEGAAHAQVRTRLIGQYNVSNLLAVIGALRSLGVPLADAARACSGLTPVPGRMQRVPGLAGAPEVVVDYAHSPDALEKALLALRPFATARGGRLWCVFGCGGNRDAGKRPLMGETAARHAQALVITSDNPRHESPQAILAQIVAGVPASADKVVIEDRRAAIEHAVRQAGPADVILLAGKGHEDYQDIKGTKLPFSDVERASAALAQRSQTP
jgi:UDP-N-acetylmuramyl-tripeptide synthetase